MNVNIVCVWCNSRDFLKRFYGGISLVYVLIYRFIIGGYLDTLITIQSQVKKDVIRNERSRRS